MKHRVVRFLLQLVVAVAVVAVSTLGVAAFWVAIGGGPLSIHGWISMTLGLSSTVALAWVLMRLAFRSEREGWDDEANTIGDPALDKRDH